MDVGDSPRVFIASIRFSPPLVISEGELQMSLSVIKQCLNDLDTVRRCSYQSFQFLGYSYVVFLSLRAFRLILLAIMIMSRKTLEEVFNIQFLVILYSLANFAT